MEAKSCPSVEEENSMAFQHSELKVKEEHTENNLTNLSKEEINVPRSEMGNTTEAVCANGKPCEYSEKNNDLKNEFFKRKEIQSELKLENGFKENDEQKVSSSDDEVCLQRNGSEENSSILKEKGCVLEISKDLENHIEKNKLISSDTASKEETMIRGLESDVKKLCITEDYESKLAYILPKIEENDREAILHLRPKEEMISDPRLRRPIPNTSSASEEEISQEIDLSKRSNHIEQTLIKTENECGKGAAVHLKNNSGKDSSIPTEDKSSQINLVHKDDDDFKIPDDALVEKIVRQVEFYFSDFNILKNNFLLKHIRRNREGYVSLKLVASFRKIKSLTRDCRVVAFSLMGSKTLEMNAERTKIRRVDPIPKIRDTSLGKTIVAFNFLRQCPTNEELKELFSKFGKVVSAEIMTTKSESYNVYHRRCLNYNQDISSKVFASIEFENYEDALSAITDVDSHLPKENKMKVVPLIAQTRRYRRNTRNQYFIPYNRRGSRDFNPRVDYPNSHLNYQSAFDIGANQRPWFGERAYRKYYPRQYPRKFTPSPDMISKDTKSKLSTESITFAEKRMASTQSRQLKANNSLNIGKALIEVRQPQRRDGSSHYIKARSEA